MKIAFLFVAAFELIVASPMAFTQPQSVHVATLNLGGINQFPFEFHDGSAELQLLTEMAPEHVKTAAMLIGLNDKDLYKRVAILKKYNDKRFSPLYNTKTTKLVAADKTPTFEEFSELWRQNYEKDKREDPQLEFEVEQEEAKKLKAENMEGKDMVDALIAFDYAMLLTLREYEPSARKCGLKRTTLERFHTENAKLYANKQQMVINYLTKHKLDALMLQEIPSVWVQDFDTQLKELGYQLHALPNGETGIILPCHVKGKPQACPKTESEFNENCVMFLDENTQIYYIVVHLSAKKPEDRPIKNHQYQWEELAAFLGTLGGKYIVGGDFNHHPNMAGKSGTIFPPDETTSTVLKMRTTLQAQLKKAGVLDRGTKDHIITNLLVNEPMKGSVETLEPMP
jgi:hypothetical protein